MGIFLAKSTTTNLHQLQIALHGHCGAVQRYLIALEMN